jgi:putative heme iron utilization protein
MALSRRDPDPAFEVERLLADSTTLVMATADGSGSPEASVAPFWRDAPYLYVYVSDLAAHTRNLSDTARARVLLLADESERANAFARRRLSFGVVAEFVPRDDAEWNRALDGLAGRFGSTVDLIRPLVDFRLFRLTPVQGTYVRGFAQAYPVRGPDLRVDPLPRSG